jgi:hypothetical protein
VEKPYFKFLSADLPGSEAEDARHLVHGRQPVLEPLPPLAPRVVFPALDGGFQVWRGVAKGCPKNELLNHFVNARSI